MTKDRQYRFASMSLQILETKFQDKIELNPDSLHCEYEDNPKNSSTATRIQTEKIEPSKNKDTSRLTRSFQVFRNENGGNLEQIL